MEKLTKKERQILINQIRNMVGTKRTWGMRLTFCNADLPDNDAHLCEFLTLLTDGELELFRKCLLAEFTPPSPASCRETKTDNVNHPAHYTSGKVECIDALESATSALKGIDAVCTANAIKYLWRWSQKNGVEDLKKANWYINALIKKLEEDAHEHRNNP